MTSETEIVIAFLFKRSGKKELKETEIYLPLSIDLKWFSVKEAREFIDYALKQKLLTKREGLFTPSFDIETVNIPSWFRPGKEVSVKKEAVDDRQSRFIDFVAQIQDCKRCSLYKSRNKIVIGQGKLDAKVMLIGEAPGFNEDKGGKPFMGRAGKIFDLLLQSISLQRDSIYITNLLKCRPPQNHDPLKEEVKICSPYLDEQIEIIKPRIIVPLGRFSASHVLLKFGVDVKAWVPGETGHNIYSINSIHGNIFKSKFDGVILPMFHPAMGLYKSEMISEMYKDFKELQGWIEYYGI